MSLTGNFRWQVSSGRVYVSDEAWQLFDLPRRPALLLKDLLARSCNGAALWPTLEAAAQQRAAIDLEHEFLIAEGTRRIRIQAQPIEADEGSHEYAGTFSERNTRPTPDPRMQVPEELRLTIDETPGLLWGARADGQVDFHNLPWLQYTGLRHEEANGWGWQQAIHPDDLPHLIDTWRHTLASRSLGEVKARFRRHDGAYRWFLFRARPYLDAAGEVQRWYGHNIDIDDLMQAETLLGGEKLLLEMLARANPLPATLEAMCRMVNQMLPGAASTVWLLDEEHQFAQLIAPGLPGDVTQAMRAAAQAGTDCPCSAAIRERTPVMVADIAADPRWNDFSALAVPYGLRACICTPVLSASGQVLGVFNLYFGLAMAPGEREQTIIDHFTHLCAVAIERECMDAALRESEARFRRMAETTPDVIWITELHPERVVYASPSFEAIWGHSVQALYANPRIWIDTIHADDVERVLRTFTAGIEHAGASSYDIEFRLLRQDGTIRWIHERAAFIADEAGRPYRASGISSDITGRKRAEAALRESQERFSLAVAASSDGIWDWNLNTGDKFMSRRAQRIYGLALDASPNASPGPTTRPRRDWRRMIRMHEADAEHQEALLRDYLEGKVATYAGEWRVMHADGSLHWVRIRGQGIRDAQGRLVRLTGSISDIDAQKHTEAALQQARRLEATGTLAAGIAHDFNNILGIVLGYGEKAARGAPPGSRLRDDLETILSAGERGRTLVERILSFSRSGPRERVAVNAEQAVRESLELISATLPTNIRIEAAFESGSAAMLGDPTEVHQVVTNLMSNAIHALAQGGTIRVGLRLLDLEAARVASTGMLGAGPYIVLDVEDNGVGIAPEVQERIFDPFFTTREVGVGSGLGLSLVHGIVAELGGAIDVHSQPGQGSGFAVYLPRTGEASDAHPAAVTPLPRGHGERILVVDDEAPLGHLAGEFLRELGYVPQVYSSSLSALEAFHAAPHAFDAVLTDERMPNMAGSALIAQMRTIRPGIPVLMMSGYLGEAATRNSRELPADAILRKPLSMQDLAHGLARVLGSSR